MKNVVTGSFADLQDFRDSARALGDLVFYHIFRGSPDRALIDLLDESGADEPLILLDIEEDRGFLTATDSTVEITADREFRAERLADRPGLGAWFKGSPLDFVTVPRDVPDLVSYARRFSSPQQPLPLLARAEPG